MSGIIVSERGPSVGGRAARQAGELVPALVVFALVIAVWQGAIAAFSIKQFLLPAPASILRAFWDSRHTLWPAGWYTLKEAMGGFAIGSVLGVLAATVVGRFKSVGTALMPIFIAANAVPIIAFAPIAGVWFNPISPHSKMAVAAVLCFLPVMVNTLRGLQSASPREIELMRSYAASELAIWRRVRIPTALPFLFTALKVASVLSMIGAVVSEYFGGTFNALGVLILNDAQILNFQQAWAGILLASLLGIALYAAVALAERLVVRWAPQRRTS